MYMRESSDKPTKAQRKKDKKDKKDKKNKLEKKIKTPTQVISQKVVVNIGDKDKVKAKSKRKPRKKVDKLPPQAVRPPQFIYPTNPSFDLVGQIAPPPQAPRPPIPQPTPSQLAIPEFTSPELNEQIKASVGAREDILTKPELKVKASPTRSLLQANQDMDFNVPLEQRPPIPSLSGKLNELRKRDAMIELQAKQRRDVVLPEQAEAKEEPDFEPAEEPSPEKRGRGRPKGAKNKPKPEPITKSTQVSTPDFKPDFEPPPAEDKDTPPSQHGILGDRPDQDTLLRRQSSEEISKEATKRRERKPKSSKLPAEEGQPAIATKAIPEATAQPIPDPTQPVSQTFSVVVKAPSDKRTTDFVGTALAGTTLSTLDPSLVSSFLLPKSPEKPTLGQQNVDVEVMGSDTQEGTFV
mgnify:CR=1 FL=1